MKTSVSIAAIISVVLLIGFVILGVVFANPATNNILIIIAGLVVSTVPSLLGAAFSERAARDIRNGVMHKKVVEGTKQALEEVGVTDVVEASQRGQATLVAIQALSRLLENNTNVTERNSDIHTEDGGHRG